MLIIKNPLKLQNLMLKLRLQNKKIGFVPTMGALHEGHLSLIKTAKKKSDIVVLSIFVNPIQFGPKEDFKKYPRPFLKDKELAEKEGVDVIFNPSPEDFYKNPFYSFVEVEKLSNVMCGASRPGHFKGVTTVVSKLLNTVMPHHAFFGQKDYQQALIIKQMVKDLNFPVEIVVCPIFREKDGLAMSSRNIYLDKEQRKNSLCLYESLNMAKKMILKQKVYDVSKIKNEMKKNILKHKDTKIDYIHFGDPETLEPLTNLKNQKDVLVALAVFVGKTRLIDNKII